MIVKLLTEHHLEFLSLKGGCRGSILSLHLSKCQIVGNHMPLIFNVNCALSKDQQEPVKGRKINYLKCTEAS